MSCELTTGVRDNVMQINYIHMHLDKLWHLIVHYHDNVGPDLYFKSTSGNWWNINIASQYMTEWFARFNQILIKFQVLQQNKKKIPKKIAIVN